MKENVVTHKKPKVITGKKGGSSKPYTPKEAPDNLISVNKIKVLLAVSDGEVEPNYSLKDLYLNDTQVQNADGSLNFTGVTMDFRPGTQTQTYIKGFNESSAETTLGTVVKQATPVVIPTITDKNLSSVRIKVATSRMVKTTNKGDRVGTIVNFSIDAAVDGGSFRELQAITWNGKTSSGYDQSYRVDIPAFNSQVIFRLRRRTADSTSDQLQNEIRLQSFALGVDAKFRYPLTGLLYVEIDSEMFPNQMPSISLRKRWKLVQVPSNYNVETRQYTGTWNGLFKMAWTNNPAWVLYDLITNQRYGLDQKELGISVDKWSLYEIAQYCDQLVPDGKGGTEPRYLCDVVIQSQTEAYRLIRDICSIFRGMSFWNGESLSIVIDKPRNPSYIFTNDNVVGGNFSYTFASEKSMYTACNVTFDDRENMFSQDIEGVFDTQASLRFNYNPTSITAIGCTRRSEANRRGRWILKTNLRSTTVNFATGLEGMIPTIGDVVSIQDVFWSSNMTLNLSGRVMEVSGLQVFTPFAVDARPGDYLMINKPDGAPQRRTIASVSADKKTITLNVGFDFQPQPGTIFAIDRTDLALQQYVVTNINKGDGDEEFTYSITAVEYDPTKYDAIDYGVNVDSRPTSNVLPDSLVPPGNVKIDSYSRIVQGLSVETMVVSWDKVEYASYYEVQWRKDDSIWQNIPRTANSEVEVEGIYQGNYFVRVRTVSATGTASAWSAVVNKGLTGKVGAPGAPINLTASDNEVFGIRVKWGMPANSEDTAYIELQQSPDGTVANASLLTMVPYPQYEYWHSILPAGYVNYYRARAVDRIGNVSAWTSLVRGFSTDDVDAIQKVVMIDIENTPGFKELKEGALTQAAGIHSAAEAAINNALLGDRVGRVTRVENGKRIAEHKESLDLIATEKEARVTQYNEITVKFGDVNSAINTKASVTQLNEAIANEEQARATQINQVSASLNTRIDGTNAEVQKRATVTQMNQAIVDERAVTAQTISSVKATIGTETDVKIAAQNTAMTTAVATETSARVQADNALSTRVGNTESAITQKLDSYVNASGAGALYNLNLGLRYNGVEYKAGMSMQLVMDAATNSLRSQVLFDAGRFAILTSSTNGNYVMPFLVENGQVIMNSAIIKNGSITNAMIGNFIRSNNYQPGSVGWNVDKDGSAEFNNVTVRGSIYAKDGYFSMTNAGAGVTIDGNGVRIDLPGGGLIVLGRW